MAIAVLERKISELEEEQKVSKATAEAQKAFDFNRRISGNYERLMRADGKTLAAEILGEPVAEKTAELTLERSVKAAPAEEQRTSVRRETTAQSPVYQAPAYPAQASARTIEAPAYQAPATTGRRMLFEGLSYKDGEIIDASAPVEAPVRKPAEAPAYRPASAPVSMPEQESEEDALPTRRTMDTLRREAVAETSVKAEASFVLSAKAKAVIAAIVLAVIVAIAVICVNTAVINSLNAEISSIESASATLRTQLAGLEDQITNVTSMDSIVAFAQEMGMVLHP